MRLFGAHFSYVVLKRSFKKLDARLRPAIMIGYSSQIKGYKLRDANKCTFVVSRDLTFDEIRNTGSKELGGNMK